jgi:DNA-binding NarL/FixJ family response regulator
MDAVYELDRTAVVVDRFPLWQDAVSRVLEGIGVRVVARAGSYDQALKLILEHRPDILLTEIDQNGPGLDGVGCLREACRQLPSLKALVLSSYEDAHHIDAALSAGAVAYVLKTAYAEDLAAAVRQVFEHSIYLAGARVAGLAPLAKPAMSESPGLTRRELEILQLVAEGHSNAQLARMLWVTEQTVKFHLSNIYRKLDVSNRTEASRWAQVQGLLPATMGSSVGAA